MGFQALQSSNVFFVEFNVGVCSLLCKLLTNFDCNLVN
jgi:hypothetical protein